MKKNSIFFVLIALIGCLIQGCTSEDNVNLPMSIRDLPVLDGSNNTASLRKAIAASYLGWSYTVESDGQVEVNCPENLTTLFNDRTRDTGTESALQNLQSNTSDIIIIDEALTESDLTQSELKQKQIGSIAGAPICVLIRESTPATAESYKLYEFMSSAQGQAIIQQCGYSTTK